MALILNPKTSRAIKENSSVKSFDSISNLSYCSNQSKEEYYRLKNAQYNTNVRLGNDSDERETTMKNSF